MPHTEQWFSNNSAMFCLQLNVLLSYINFHNFGLLSVCDQITYLRKIYLQYFFVINIISSFFNDILDPGSIISQMYCFQCTLNQKSMIHTYFAIFRHKLFSIENRHFFHSNVDKSSRTNIV